MSLPFQMDELRCPQALHKIGSHSFGEIRKHVLYDIMGGMRAWSDWSLQWDGPGREQKAQMKILMNKTKDPDGHVFF